RKATSLNIWWRRASVWNVNKNGKIETDNQKQIESEDTVGIPKSNGYANELRYFTDCVKNDTFPDKVKPDELEEVITILKSL
ncbi:MAG: hypothetical protein IKI68_04315, partial [Clostridia bacterium]|nr:hypothetical protein [Clostridia bacterium]